MALDVISQPQLFNAELRIAALGIADDEEPVRLS